MDDGDGRGLVGWFGLFGSQLAFGGGVLGLDMVGLGTC